MDFMRRYWSELFPGFMVAGCCALLWGDCCGGKRQQGEAGSYPYAIVAPRTGGAISRIFAM